MRRVATLSLVTVAASIAIMATARAQQIVGSGNSLDANLRLGSGGYNGAVGAGRGMRTGGRPFRETIYRGQYGHIDYRNAFTEQRRYDPTGSSVRRDDHRRFEPGRDHSSTSRFGEGFDKGYVAGLADGAEQAAPLPEAAQHQMEQISYALGYFLGEEVRAGLERDEIDADPDSVIRGFRDGLFENLPRVPRIEMEEVLAELHGQVEAKLVEALQIRDPDFRKLSEDNLRRSREFHEEFGSRPGVVTLPNGIQYQVIRAGDGPSPGPDDQVVVTFRILLLDGSVASEGTAEVVRVSSVVDGGAQILGMMKTGAKWLIAVPPEMGHGPGGKFPEIGPNETLFGEIELVRVAD